MVVYVDPKFIGRDNYNRLVKKYSNIEFVTDVDRKSELEVLITMPKIVKEMNLDDYPRLKWIQYLMAGYDGLDFSELRKRNITFCNAQDIFSKSIAEDVFAKILYFNRNIKYYLESMKEGKWEPIGEEPELTGSTVLILGVGSIGKELAKRFKAFEMNVIGYRSNYIEEKNFDKIITKTIELKEALKIADYVVLALPLTETTKYMFDKSMFEIMDQNALLINVARGKIVNQEDLYQALLNKQIRGAGLDVLDPEPLPSDSPLWKLPNVYITPHNASSSPHMRNRLYNMIIMNLDLYLSGEPVKYQL
ncbi:D-2-hydroxyacid dehydrogenase [Mycoplasmatota bacterium WC30]